MGRGHPRKEEEVKEVVEAGLTPTKATKEPSKWRR